MMLGHRLLGNEIWRARRITVEEAALLQSFPAGTAFAGRRSSQYRQVGNAVPPLLAEQVGLALRRQFFS